MFYETQSGGSTLDFKSYRMLVIRALCNIEDEEKLYVDYNVVY